MNDAHGKPPDQAEVFWRSEGDAWFRRNKVDLDTGVARDPILKLMESQGLRPRRVIEIGASNGYRLASINERFGSFCLAIEPSLQAIDDGRRRFPQVEFRRGRADAVPVAENERFDVTVVHFVLHWIDRRLLLRSVAEIDRVLEDAGHLLLGDFLPDAPTKVPYHHLPGESVFTFKQDYAALFIQSGLYVNIARMTYDSDDPLSTTVDDPARRCSVACLQKRLDASYVTAQYRP